MICSGSAGNDSSNSKQSEISTKYQKNTYNPFIASRYTLHHEFYPQNAQKSAEMSAEEEKRSAEAVLNSSSMKANLCIMERVVTRNIYQSKQALYRGMKILPDPDSASSKVLIPI